MNNIIIEDLAKHYCSSSQDNLQGLILKKLNCCICFDSRNFIWIREFGKISDLNIYTFIANAMRVYTPVEINYSDHEVIINLTAEGIEFKVKRLHTPYFAEMPDIRDILKDK
jgi:hypothetical protein